MVCHVRTKHGFMIFGVKERTEQNASLCESYRKCKVGWSSSYSRSGRSSSSESPRSSMSGLSPPIPAIMEAMSIPPGPGGASCRHVVIPSPPANSPPMPGIPPPMPPIPPMPPPRPPMFFIISSRSPPPPGAPAPTSPSASLSSSSFHLPKSILSQCALVLSASRRSQ